MCFLTDGVKSRPSHQELRQVALERTPTFMFISVTDQGILACLCWDPHPRIPAYFCISFLMTQAMKNLFCSTRTVIAKAHSEFTSVIFALALPGVNHQFYSDIYDCVSSGKPCAVVTGSWQVQEKCKWSFIGIVLFLKIPFRKWNKKYWLNWTDWHVRAC